MALMKSQHKDLMRALLAGAYDKNGAAPAIAGGSGEHPADAAAAVAVTTAETGDETAPEPLRQPPVAAAHPGRESTRRASDGGARARRATLDEAIRHYLEKFAATAAAAAN